MKYQTPKDYLAELASSAPPEDQQTLRAELKSLALSPMLAALIAQRLESTVREARVVERDSAVSPKLDNILVRLTALEKRLESTAAPSAGNDTKVGSKIAEQVQGLREDMRGVQNHLIANRPLSWKKVFFVSLVLLVIGGVAGWHVRREYRLWQYEQSQGGSQK